MRAGDHFARLRDVWRACLCNRDGSFHPAGKEVIDNLKQLTAFGDTPFNSDPLLMARNVGRQEVVKHIMKLLDLSDEQVELMNRSGNSNEDEGGFEL